MKWNLYSSFLSGKGDFPALNMKHYGLTAAKFEGAGMSIHREILQLHGTLRWYGQSEERKIKIWLNLDLHLWGYVLEMIC